MSKNKGDSSVFIGAFSSEAAVLKSMQFLQCLVSVVILKPVPEIQLLVTLCGSFGAEKLKEKRGETVKQIRLFA